MISQIVLDPGVQIDDAWAARIANSFTASLKQSQNEIASLITDALMKVSVWDASEKIVKRTADGIVKALGTTGLAYALRYRKKGRWTLMLVSIYLRGRDDRIIVECVKIDGRAIETNVRVRGRILTQRTLQQPIVVDVLELSRHSFERFIQRAGLHRPRDVVNIFRDEENLHALLKLAFDDRLAGEALFPINTPAGPCALVVVRDDPLDVFVATTLLCPPFTDAQHAKLDAIKARLAP